MEPWVRVAVLSAGGALGVNARYWLGVWVSRWADPGFPWSTLAINVSGSFGAGFLAVALVGLWPHPYARLLLMVGFLGGYTTFSAFALETLILWERGQAGRSLAYAAGSVTAGLVAVALGAGLARGLTDPVAPPQDPGVTAPRR